MKKLLSLILIILMLAMPLVSCNTDTPKDTDTSTDTGTSDPDLVAPALRETDEELYVGYGRTCITPYDESGKLIEGYTLAGYAERRNAVNVKDDLYASCTAVKDKNGNIAIMFALDLHSMGVSYATTLKRLVEREYNIPEENIFLNVTHTHAAPHLSDGYENFVSDKVVETAGLALEDLTLVTALYTGTVRINGMNFIRRYIYDETGKPIAHIAENDPYMPVVRFVRDGKKDVILTNWAAHCDTVKGNNPTTISADYVGYFREEAESVLDAHVSLFMAASGDVNPRGHLDGEPTFPGTSRYGKQLATNLISNIDNLKRCDIKSEVAASFEKVRVQFDHSTDDKAEAAKEVMNYFWDVAGSQITPELTELIKEHGFQDIYDAMYVRNRSLKGIYERLEVGALSIGNVVFAIAPYEMFTKNGVDIKASADEFDGAFMCAYTNGMIGYIASAEAFDHNIYEVYSRLYVKGTAEALADSMIATIDELGK